MSDACCSHDDDTTLPPPPPPSPPPFKKKRKEENNWAVVVFLSGNPLELVHSRCHWPLATGHCVTTTLQENILPLLPLLPQCQVVSFFLFIRFYSLKIRSVVVIKKGSKCVFNGNKFERSSAAVKLIEGLRWRDDSSRRLLCHSIIISPQLVTLLTYCTRRENLCTVHPPTRGRGRPPTNRPS